MFKEAQYLQFYRRVVDGMRYKDIIEREGVGGCGWWSGEAVQLPSVACVELHIFCPWGNTGSSWGDGHEVLFQHSLSLDTLAALKSSNEMKY